MDGTQLLPFCPIYTLCQVPSGAAGRFRYVQHVSKFSNQLIMAKNATNTNRAPCSRSQRHLPSAAASRKPLLKKLSNARSDGNSPDARDPIHCGEVVQRQQMAEAYDYLYHQSLAECVARLEDLEKYTKAIVGEQGYVASPAIFLLKVRLDSCDPQLLTHLSYV